MYKIGTESESSLHRTLKFRYAGTDGETEAEVAGFVADGINAGGEYIEVQTGSFGPLKAKAKAFAVHGRLRIVYPVIITKYIEVFDPSKGGKVRRTPLKLTKPLYRRKSPRRGSPWDLFNALLYAPELALMSDLCIELALIDAVEKRIRDGKGSWRRKKVSVLDRELEVWHESICLEKPEDYLRFVPFKKSEAFTVSMLAEKTGIGVNLARKTLYVLTKIKVVRRIGKKGNAFVYNTMI